MFDAFVLICSTSAVCDIKGFLPPFTLSIKVHFGAHITCDPLPDPILCFLPQKEDKVSMEAQDTHPRLPFLWKSSLEGHKFRGVHVKTFPDVLVGAEWPRCFVLETKLGIPSQHCVFYSAASSVSV